MTADIYSDRENLVDIGEITLPMSRFGQRSNWPVSSVKPRKLVSSEVDFSLNQRLSWSTPDLLTEVDSKIKPLDGILKKRKKIDGGKKLRGRKK